MKKIIPFNYHNFSVKVIFIDDEPWFIAKDIAEVLGYIRKDNRIDTNGMVRRLYNDDKRDLKRDDFNSSRLFGNQGSISIISEAGLYMSIFGSKKKEAEDFKKWVTREVLPQIRKTGSYSISKTDEADLDKLKKRAELIHFATNLVIDYKKSFLEIGITRQEELGITVNRAVAKDSTVDFLEIAEKKGLSTTEKYFTVTELCEIVRNGDFSEEAKKLVSTKNGEKPRPQNLNKILEKEGFQFRENEIWKTTEKGQEFSDFVQNKSKHSEKTVFHTVWKKEILNKLF
jgi:prophage antirepressor-like protein